MNFSQIHTVAEEKQIFDEEKVLRTAGEEFTFPFTILAAGDVAKCNGEEEWRERFLRLVGWLPDTGPQEPFFENLLELLSQRRGRLSSQCSHDSQPDSAFTRKSPYTRIFSIPNWVNPSISRML
jgi:hypothetical protein